jgi:amino acid transporter
LRRGSDNLAAVADVTERATSSPGSHASPPLGLGTLLALGINGIVGVGIFFAPREVATAVPGWGGVAVYLGVALLLLPTGLVYARLGRAFPADGGPYLYAREAFGKKMAFAVGFTTYVSALFSTSTVIVGLVENVTASIGVTDGTTRLVIELVLLSALSAALSVGLKLSAVAWTVVTLLKATPLLALPVAALFVAGAGYGVETDVGLAAGAATTLSNAMEGAATAASVPNVSILSAALPVLFALQGFEVVPLPAAQVKNAARNVPLATLASLVFAALLYMALHAACVAALPDLAAHELPLGDAARVYGGPIFSKIVVTATSASAFGIVIGFLAMTPRYLAPLGAPDALGFGLDRLSARAVPLRAFAATYVLLALILIATAMWGSIRNLLALSSLCVTLQYAVTAGSLFVLASRGVAGLKRGDRWPAPFSMLAFVMFLLGSSRMEVPVLVAMIAVGFAVRAVGQRQRRAA